MADKAYFGCLPKEEVPKFIENVKKGLGEAKKEGEKKELEFTIRGTKEEPKGVAFELFTLKKEKFNEFIDIKQPHLAKALSVISVSFGAKDEASVGIFKETLAKFEPMINQLPFMTKHPGKYKYNLRSEGKRVFAEFYTEEGKFLQPILDLGINPEEFHTFLAKFKTNFIPSDLFDLDVEALTKKFMQIVISFTSESNNIKFLLSAIIKALKEVKIDNASYQAKKDKVLGYLNFFNAFVGAKTVLEFDANELIGTGMSVQGDFTGGMDLNSQFAQYKQFAETTGKEMIKPALESFGMLDVAKNVEIDEINIAIGVPKYETGIAQTIRFPGFSKIFIEKFLA